MIKSFINIQGSTQQERDTAQLQAQNMAQILQQNQMAYEQDPMSYETQNIMENQSPEDIDEIIAQIAASEGGRVGQRPSRAQAIEGQAPETGEPAMTPDMGSMMANPASFGEGAY
jgi:hypothetical protein